MIELNTIIHKFRNVNLLLKRIFWTNILLFASIVRRIKIGPKTTSIGHTFIYKKPGSAITIGNNCRFNSHTVSNMIGINHRCMISTHKNEANIKIGSNCGFSGTVIAAFVSIEIGDNVKCGANTLITDSDWHLDDPRSGIPSPIIIGENVWLGINSVILKGVHVGANTVIGANSVVTKSLPANVIAAGNPCRVVKILDYK